MLGAVGSSSSVASAAHPARLPHNPEDGGCIHQAIDLGYPGEAEEQSGSEYHCMTSPKDNGDIRNTQSSDGRHSPGAIPRSLERPLTARHRIQPVYSQVGSSGSEDDHHPCLHPSAPSRRVGGSSFHRFSGPPWRVQPNEALSLRASQRARSSGGGSSDSLPSTDSVNGSSSSSSGEFSVFSRLWNLKLGGSLKATLSNWFGRLKCRRCFSCYALSCLPSYRWFSSCWFRKPIRYLPVFPSPRDSADASATGSPAPHRSGDLLILSVIAAAIILSFLRFFAFPFSHGIRHPSRSAAEVAYQEIDQEMLRLGFLKSNESHSHVTAALGNRGGFSSFFGAAPMWDDPETKDDYMRHPYFDQRLPEFGTFQIPYFGTLNHQESFGERDVDLGLLDLKLFEANPIANVYLTAKTRRAEFHRRSCSSYPEIRIHLGSEDLTLFSKYLMVQRNRWAKMVFDNLIGLLRLRRPMRRWNLRRVEDGGMKELREESFSFIEKEVIEKEVIQKEGDREDNGRKLSTDPSRKLRLSDGEMNEQDSAGRPSSSASKEHQILKEKTFRKRKLSQERQEPSPTHENHSNKNHSKPSSSSSTQPGQPTSHPTPTGGFDSQMADVAVWASSLDFPIFPTGSLQERSDFVEDFVRPFLPFRYFEFGMSGATAQVPGFAAETYSVEFERNVCSAVRDDLRVGCLVEKKILTIYCPTMEDGEREMEGKVEGGKAEGRASPNRGLAGGEGFANPLRDVLRDGLRIGSDWSPHPTGTNRSAEGSRGRAVPKGVDEKIGRGRLDGDGDDVLEGKPTSSGDWEPNGTRTNSPSRKLIMKYIHAIDRPVEEWLEGFGLTLPNWDKQAGGINLKGFSEQRIAEGSAIHSSNQFDNESFSQSDLKPSSERIAGPSNLTSNLNLAADNPSLPSDVNPSFGFVTPFYGMIYINGDYPISALLYSMRYLAPWSIVLFRDWPPAASLGVLFEYFDVIESHLDPPMSVVGRRGLVDRTLKVLRMKSRLTRQQILESYLRFLV